MDPARLFDPRILLATVPVFLFSLSLHEFLHAWAADRLGDPGPRLSGRLTINPLAHYDIVGTTFGLLFRVFGWAKPVPVNPLALQRPKRDMMLTALGGPAVNVVLAICFLVAFRLLQLVDPAGLGGGAKTFELFERMAAYGVFLNLALAIFNLIPLYPLDGHHIVRGFLNDKATEAYERTKHIGGYILMFLIVLSFATRGPSILSIIIFRPILFITQAALTNAQYVKLWNIVSLLMPW